VGLHWEPASCSKCSCDDSTIACKADVTLLNGSGDCVDASLITCKQSVTIDAGACVATPCSGGITTALGSLSGTCAASVQAPSKTQITWDERLVSCLPDKPTDRGCKSGEKCAPSPPSPLSTKLCIHKHGDSLCPAGEYSEKTLVHADVTDTRACSDCSCGSATVTCKGTLQLNTTATCDPSSVENYDLPYQSCWFFSTGAKVAMKYVATPTNPSCVPSGGEASGSVVEASPETFCCQS
jgi:hypothetical protein